MITRKHPVGTVAKIVKYAIAYFKSCSERVSRYMIWLYS
jgi:hypothetical protein